MCHLVSVPNFILFLPTYVKIILFCLMHLLVAGFQCVHVVHPLNISTIVLKDGIFLNFLKQTGTILTYFGIAG